MSAVSAKHSPGQSTQPPAPSSGSSSSLSSIATANLSATNAAGPLTAALIKEYLAARGLTKTLEAFKLEFLQFQKTPPISSRQELADQLGIAKLVKQNKAQDQPLKTQIEIIVKYLVSRAQKDQPVGSTTPTTTPSSAKPRTITSAASTGKHQTLQAAQDVNLSHSPTISNSAQPQGLEPLDAPSTIIFKTPLGGFNASNPRAISAAPNKATPAASRPSSSWKGETPLPSTSKRGTSAAISQPPPPIQQTNHQTNLHKSVGLVATLAKENASKTSSQKPTPHIQDEDPSDSPEMSGTLEGFTKSTKFRPQSTPTTNEPPPPSSSTTPKKQTHPANDLEILDDFDDDEYSITSDLGNPLAPTKLGVPRGPSLDTPVLEAPTGGALIPTREAYLLRKLVFPGTIGGGEESRARSSFTEEWRGKGFVFSTNPDLAYGTVQIKGGPCGLLASVQAFVLKHLLFVEKAHNVRLGKLRPGVQQSQTALIDAFTEILWQAGGTRHRRAVVAIYNPSLRVNSGVNLQREKYVPDGITENMQLFEFFDINQLRAFLTANIGTFTVNDPNRHGLIQLLYSVILSRGPETIREEDFDEVDCSMIGRHGYCTQEMVNLILMGQAISNVHDGDFKLGDGPDVKILKGMKKTCQFGYLSLFEHYGSLKVGDYYKTPTLPIYVICSESHFTVLFCLDKDILFKTGHHTRLQDKLELFYYDGLANQDEEIMLEVVLGESGGKKGKTHNADSGGGNGGGDALVPPLELVLKTRWPDISKVTWRGSEPLL
ncbi:hypothetical protein HDU79_001717 [Rhizoclosmatium sp. JEL0117]|nr:hypothetical protein HDU79_001717 [Rhizoclosmatium sp. JEL0117]